MYSLKSYGVRHKVFISYHHVDQDEVNMFVEMFDSTHDIFIARALGLSNDIINSTDTDYIMRRIRQLYLQDSTVTIVLMGKCTWARRYVDWEIQASLRQGDSTIPNGLLGVKLQSYDNSQYPERLNFNLKQDPNQKECYARAISYPITTASLAEWIEDAFYARATRNHLIMNPRNKFFNNKGCE